MRFRMIDEIGEGAVFSVYAETKEEVSKVHAMLLELEANDDAPPVPPIPGVDPKDIKISIDAQNLNAGANWVASGNGTYVSPDKLPLTAPEPISPFSNMRIGAVSDPQNVNRKAVAFLLHPKDKITSGSPRTEISCDRFIKMDETYWVAFSAFYYKWGAEFKEGLFGCQCHAGDTSKGFSPSFSLYLRNATEFIVQTRHYKSGNTQVKWDSAHHKVPFEQWTDFVFQFRHNLSGAGFLRCWMGDSLLADYRGNLGFYTTPASPDYMKFGIYQWGGLTVPRKLLLRRPLIVRDDAGRYNKDIIRALVQP